MGAISRYIIRTTFGAFLMILVSLTSIIWVTHALREIDLITNQGQTILVFISMTGLLIPQLVFVIAPLALMIAVTYTLNKLNADSEIIVMTASGMSPWKLFVPFFYVALVVAVVVAFIAFYLSPEGLRQVRSWAMKVRADLVTNIVQPGRFILIEPGLTFHIRERRSNGQLAGIFIDDRRAPERSTFLAEHGEILESPRGIFLVLQNGSVQRQEPNRDPTIVRYDRYAFDLSKFNPGEQTRTLGVRERYLWDLYDPDPNDPLVKTQAAQMRAEFHDRLTAPLYPLVFVFLTYAILGAPRTTRQGRGMSLGLAIAGVTVLRLAGFACAVFGASRPGALIGIYVCLGIGLIFGIVAISRGAIIEPPEAVTAFFTRLAERLERRTAKPA